MWKEAFLIIFKHCGFGGLGDLFLRKTPPMTQNCNHILSQIWCTCISTKNQLSQIGETPTIFPQLNWGQFKRPWHSFQSSLSPHSSIPLEFVVQLLRVQLNTIHILGTYSGHNELSGGIYIKYNTWGKIPVKSTISYVSSFLLLKKHFSPFCSLKRRVLSISQRRRV